MTPSPEREPQQKEPWFVTDRELANIFFNGDQRYARELLLKFDEDKRSGFPPKLALFGDRRYLAAVRAYFNKLYIPKMMDDRLDPRLYPRRAS